MTFLPLIAVLLAAPTPTADTIRLKAALQAAPRPSAPPTHIDACVALIRSDAAAAIKEADAWRAGGGGLLALQCLGLAYVALERWRPAASAFEQAAKQAEIERDGRAAPLWVHAGNAALAGNDPGKARRAFDRALALPVLSGPLRGEAHLDRARAAVAGNDPSAARSDIDVALKLVPGDPMAWLLSATLARRQGDAKRAAKDLAEAERLAPGDETIAAERERIAVMGKP